VNDNFSVAVVYTEVVNCKC